MENEFKLKLSDKHDQERITAVIERIVKSMDSSQVTVGSILKEYAITYAEYSAIANISMPFIRLKTEAKDWRWRFAQAQRLLKQHGITHDINDPQEAEE